MTTRRFDLPRRASVFLIVTASLSVAPFANAAAAKNKNPASKLYVADLNGEASIDTGESVEDLSKRSVYTAQGTVIETKRPEKEEDKDKYNSTMVYSNGTGAFFDADTRVELRQFVQEPFTPTRSDMETEPSISQTQAFVARGAVGLCNSRLVAGTNMNYATPQGSVSIRGKRVVIEARGDVTKISMIEGDSTVRGSERDLGGHTLHSGEQAIIRRGQNGAPNSVEIIAIPQSEKAELDNRVTLACNARRTVYFDVQERSGATPTTTTTPGQEEGTGPTPVSAFDPPADTTGTTVRDIVPIPVVPVQVPVEVVVSPASLPPTNPNPPGNG